MASYVVRYTYIDVDDLKEYSEKKFFYFRSNATKFVRLLTRDKSVKDIHLINICNG